MHHYLTKSYYSWCFSGRYSYIIIYNLCEEKLSVDVLFYFYRLHFIFNWNVFFFSLTVGIEATDFLTSADSNRYMIYHKYKQNDRHVLCKNNLLTDYSVKQLKNLPTSTGVWFISLSKFQVLKKYRSFVSMLFRDWLIHIITVWTEMSNSGISFYA